MLSSGLGGCDDLVFTKGENEAKRNYQEIKVGISRQSVTEKLGAPMFELSWNAGDKRYEYIDPNRKRISVDLTQLDKPDVPPELRFLPRDLGSPKVLVYSAGTVFGYIGLDAAERVSVVKVAVS